MHLCISYLYIYHMSLYSSIYIYTIDVNFHKSGCGGAFKVYALCLRDARMGETYHEAERGPAPFRTCDASSEHVLAHVPQWARASCWLRSTLRLLTSLLLLLLLLGLDS